MDAVDLRYSAGAKLRDVLICLALALVVGSVLGPIGKRFVYDFGSGLAGLMAIYAGSWALLVLVVGLWRWERRGRVDADGASVAGSRRGPLTTVAWSEVAEIFALRPLGYELRGEGGSVRLSGDFDDLDKAGEIVGRRSAALEADLGRAFEGGGTLRFRGPMEPREAALNGALLAFLLMPAILVPLGFATFRWSTPRSGDAAVIGVVLAAWVGLLLAFALSSRARACGWMEVGPDGVRARPAWRTRGCRWDELSSVERDRGGRLLLRLKAGGSIAAQADWSNLDALEAILRRKC